MTRGSVKVIGLLGLLILLMLTYDKVASESGGAVSGTPIVQTDNGHFSAELSEYVFLHQNRDDDGSKIHVGAGMTACPE